MSNLSEHLEFLFQDDNGYVYSPYKKKDGTWVQQFFSWPTDKAKLQDHLQATSLECDVYLSPVIYKEKKVSNSSISHSNVVWIEFDGKTQISWNKIPEPSVIIQTSSASHLHCFWKIDPVGTEALEEVNRRLTYFLEADGSGWDATQVLRPPDTFNYKHNLPTKLLKSSNTKFGLESFDKAPKIERNPEVFEYDKLLDVEQVIKDNSLDPSLVKKIKSEIVLYPHRSEFLFKLGNDLAEHGLDAHEIVSCLYVADSRIKKFVGRSDQLKRLGEIASIAVFKSEQNFYLNVYSPNDILTHSVDLDWIWPGILHKTGMIIITGQPGVGKTQLCFDLAYRLASGSTILNKQLSRPFIVLFLSLEMDVVELQYIFKLQAQAFPSKELWNENLKIVSPDWDSSLQAFEKTLEEINPDVLIIDSISEMASDDLKEQEARTIVRWMKKIRKSLNVAIIAIHHNRKASDSNKKPRKLSDLYGSFIFAKATDGVFNLWHEEGREALDFESLKLRFDRQQNFKLKRTEYLTFEIFTEPVKIEIEGVNVDPESGRTEKIKGLLDFG